MSNLIWIGLIILGVAKYINKQSKKFEENRPKRQQGGTTSAFPAQVTPIKEEDMTNGTPLTKTEIDEKRRVQRENRDQRRAEREDIKTDNRDSSYQGELTMSEMRPGREYASKPISSPEQTQDTYARSDSSMPPPLPEEQEGPARESDIFDILFPNMPRPDRPQVQTESFQPAAVVKSSVDQNDTRTLKAKTALEQYEEKFMGKDAYAKKKNTPDSSSSSPIFEFIGQSEGRVMDLDLDDPMNVRRAIVYSEIFKRKYE